MMMSSGSMGIVMLDFESDWVWKVSVGVTTKHMAVCSGLL